MNLLIAIFSSLLQTIGDENYNSIETFGNLKDRSNLCHTSILSSIIIRFGLSLFSSSLIVSFTQFALSSYSSVYFDLCLQVGINSTSEGTKLFFVGSASFDASEDSFESDSSADYDNLRLIKLSL